jgi:hypothetical protein
MTVFIIFFVFSAIGAGLRLRFASKSVPVDSQLFQVSAWTVVFVLACHVGVLTLLYLDQARSPHYKFDTFKVGALVFSPICAVTLIALFRSYVLIEEERLVVSNGFTKSTVGVDCLMSVNVHPWGFWILKYKSGSSMKRITVGPVYKDSELLIKKLKQLQCLNKREASQV